MTKIDTVHARAALETSEGGGISEDEISKRVARDARATARRVEVSQMLRDEEVARAAARTELKHIRAEIA